MPTPICPQHGERLTQEMSTNGDADAIYRWVCASGDFASDWQATGETVQLYRPTESKAEDRRFDWQLVAGENKPIYIGTAPPGTATSADVWIIEKYTFITGPAGGSVPALIEKKSGAWDDRATLF